MDRSLPPRGSFLLALALIATHALAAGKIEIAPHDFAHLAVRGEVYDDALREQRLTPEDARAIQDAAWWAVRNAGVPPAGPASSRRP
jgi:hypothetical protein